MFRSIYESIFGKENTNKKSDEALNKAHVKAVVLENELKLEQTNLNENNDCPKVHEWHGIKDINVPNENEYNEKQKQDKKSKYEEKQEKKQEEKKQKIIEEIIKEVQQLEQADIIKEVQQADIKEENITEVEQIADIKKENIKQQEEFIENNNEPQEESIEDTDSNLLISDVKVKIEEEEELKNVSYNRNITIETNNYTGSVSDLLSPISERSNESDEVKFIKTLSIDEQINERYKEAEKKGEVVDLTNSDNSDNDNSDNDNYNNQPDEVSNEEK